jgi:hypothetical protein
VTGGGLPVTGYLEAGHPGLPGALVLRSGDCRRRGWLSNYPGCGGDGEGAHDL